ncbi:MAG TPA: prepilin-type N-terminal cleavage/methylation domain-containing protein [Steroidobacteraceae bacterium]|jgi:MSHA biogenesis protein MshO
MSRRPPRAAGFTLVELIVVIVVTAIVASFMVLFLDAPVQSYFAQTRRSDLVDSANRITRAVTADARTALPNSMRVNAARTALELLSTTGVARYYGQGDKSPPAPPPPQAGEELTIGTPASTFGTLESFTAQARSYQAPYLSIGNLGATPYNAYNSANGVMTPATTVVTVGPNPSLAPPPPFVAAENQVTLSAQMTFKAAGAPATQPSVHNAYLVSGPVSYVCNSNPRNPSAGTVMRYSGYAVRAAQPVPPAGGSSALIAHDVSACTISIVAAPAGYAYGQLAILDVTLTSNGETLQVFFEMPTEYSR